MEASANPDMGRSFGFREEGFAGAPLLADQSFDQPHLALMETGYASSLALAAGSSEMRFSAFAGDVETTGNDFLSGSPSMFGALAELRTDLDGGVLKASLGTMSEEGSLLGSISEGAFGSSLRSSTFFTNLGASLAIAEDTRLTLTGALGHSSFRQKGGIIESGRDIITSSFGVGISRQGLLQEEDVLSLALAQPLRVESGRINLSVPTSRSIDGRVSYSRLSLSPNPSGREINLQASYGFDLMAGVRTSVGAMHRFDADHVQGRDETVGMLGVSLRF